MGKKALIVADMLNDFIDPKGSLYVGPVGRQIIPFVAAKIEATRRQGGVVIFVCDAHAIDDREFKYFAPHAVKGTWGSQVIPELPMKPGDYRVDKTRYSAFAGTNLEEVLHQLRRCPRHDHLGTLGRLFHPRAIHITHRAQARAIQGIHVPGVVRPHVAQPDHAYPNLVHDFSSNASARPTDRVFA